MGIFFFLSDEFLSWSKRPPKLLQGVFIMNKRQEYLDLQKRQQDELSAFPIAYAFNEEQLKEALEKLGARKEECVTYLGMGDVMKRSDVPAFKKMLVRHHDDG